MDQSRPRLPVQDGRLLSVAWPMIAIALRMLSMCVASLSLLSSIRAFVNGEGMWSKAERQAVAELRDYARSGNPDNYLRFHTEIAVDLGDRTARLQLQSPHPDYAAPGTLERLAANAEVIHHRVAPLEDEFSASFSAGRHVSPTSCCPDLSGFAAPRSLGSAS